MWHALVKEAFYGDLSDDTLIDRVRLFFGPVTLNE